MIPADLRFVTTGLTSRAVSGYNRVQFWGLANNHNELNNNKLKNVQGISGFGRFFVQCVTHLPNPPFSKPC